MHRCIFCNKPILGRYYYDWVGHSVCESHYKSVVRCASCGQFCDSKAKSIGLGEFICQHCQTYRIGPKEADDIIAFIKQKYNGAGLVIGAKWHLKMISAETLFRKTGDKNTRGLAQMVGSKYTIFIYRELSRVAFAQVLAHELLHIYQYTRHYNPEKSECEGFCNLGSYFILCAIGNDESKAAIESLKRNTDPAYGDGFRKFLAIFEQSGWQGAIKHLK